MTSLHNSSIVVTPSFSEEDTLDPLCIVMDWIDTKDMKPIVKSDFVTAAIVIATHTGFLPTDPNFGNMFQRADGTYVWIDCEHYIKVQDDFDLSRDNVDKIIKDGQLERSDKM